MKKSQIFYFFLLVGLISFSALAILVSFSQKVTDQDLKLFWLAACNLEDNFKYCKNYKISESALESGKLILNTYPIWAHYIFKYFARLDLEALNFTYKIVTVVILSSCFATLAQLYNFVKIKFLTLPIIFTILYIFAPFRDLFRSGQITSIQLLSLSLFLLFFDSNEISKKLGKWRIPAAGIFLSLSLIKPQALYLVYLVFLSSIFRANKITFAVLSTICIVFTIIVLGDDLANFHTYFSKEKFEYLFYWKQPNLMALIFPDHFAARFIFPLIVSGIILIALLKFLVDLRLITLIIIPLSLLSTPYSFSYDSILLLPTICYFLKSTHHQIILILSLLLCLTLNHYYLMSQVSCAIYPLIFFTIGIWSYLFENSEQTTAPL